MPPRKGLWSMSYYNNDAIIGGYYPLVRLLFGCIHQLERVVSHFQ